jgi:hypothetical protein
MVKTDGSVLSPRLLRSPCLRFRRSQSSRDFGTRPYHSRVLVRCAWEISQCLDVEEVTGDNRGWKVPQAQLVQLWRTRLTAEHFDYGELFRQ